MEILQEIQSFIDLQNGGDSRVQNAKVLASEVQF